MTVPHSWTLDALIEAFEQQLGWYLRDFARYAERTEHRSPLTVDLAMRWALSSGAGDPWRAERRLRAVRQFARYRAAFDSATEVPPAGLLSRTPLRKHTQSREPGRGWDAGRHRHPRYGGTRRISPHTLRHTTAMHLLQSGVDITVIALWLGHENPATTHL